VIGGTADSGHGLEAAVRETLAVVLGRPIGPGDPVRRDEQADWDSLKHIELVFALEDALRIRFAADEIGELTDVASIVELAERHHAP
jgi:acyl carrier protein